MSRHKTPRLNPRNWEDVIEAGDVEDQRFEKLKHHQHVSEQGNDAKRRRPVSDIPGSRSFNRSQLN